MTKLKNNSRKRFGNNKSKRSRKTKRSRKSRKLRGTTKKRRSKMRGGMNMMGLLAALVAVLKTDTNLSSYEPDKQFDAVNKNVPFLQKNINAGNINAGNTEIPTNFDLKLYIGEMNDKKAGTDDDGFKQMLENDFVFGDYQIDGDSYVKPDESDVKPDESDVKSDESDIKPDESDVKSDESGYSKEEYFEANNIHSSL